MLLVLGALAMIPSVQADVDADGPLTITSPSGLYGEALDGWGDSDEFRFAGTAGMVAIITITSDQVFNIQLKNPFTFAEIDAAYDVTGIEIIAALLPTTTTYAITIQTFEDTATYDLHFELVATDGSVTLTNLTDEELQALESLEDLLGEFIGGEVGDTTGTIGDATGTFGDIIGTIGDTSGTTDEQTGDGEEEDFNFDEASMEFNSDFSELTVYFSADMTALYRPFLAFMDADQDGEISATEAATLTDDFASGDDDDEEDFGDGLYLDGQAPTGTTEDFQITGLEGPVDATTPIKMEMTATITFDVPAADEHVLTSDPENTTDDDDDPFGDIGILLRAPDGWKITEVNGVAKGSQGVTVVADDLMGSEGLRVVFEKGDDGGLLGLPALGIPLVLLGLFGSALVLVTLRRRS